MNEFLKIENKSEFLVLKLISKNNLINSSLKEVLAFEGWNLSFEESKIFLEKDGTTFFYIERTYEIIEELLDMGYIYFEKQ